MFDFPLDCLALEGASLVDCFCVFAGDLLSYIFLYVLEAELVVEAVAILLRSSQSLLFVLFQGL